MQQASSSSAGERPYKPTHIAIAVESLGGGGVQRRTLSLATAFAAAGHTVDVYTVKPSPDIALPTGVAVHQFDGSGLALAQALQNNPPDLLLSTGTTLHPVASEAKRRLPHLPLIIRADSHPFRPIPWRRLRQRLLEPIRRRARRRWYRTADLIIAVSEDVAEAVRDIAPRTPVTVLPSPVITAEFAANLALGTPDHPWAHEKVPVAVSIGRFALSKDYPTLIRALALVRRNRPLRLVILGDGPETYRRELLNLADDLGIASDLALLGWTTDVPRWLARADVMVSTSIWEGSPGAVIEALAVGCPIVATDSPGDTRRLLDGGRLGALAPIGDTRAIAAAIERQLDNPGSRALRREAAAPYEETRACAAYLDALAAFMQSRR